MEVKRTMYYRLSIVVLLVFQTAYFTLKSHPKGVSIDGAEHHTLSSSSMTTLFYGNIDETSPSLCQVIDPTLPFQLVWEQKKGSILNVSLMSNNETKNIRANKNFTNWVEESMSYFTYSRLQHSMISRPMDQSRSIGRIHSIIQQKLASPESALPLRIVVFGGSVTMGHECNDNIFNYPIMSGRSQTINKCPWPARLQDMIDEILGVGVVEIRNMAVGGAATDMAIAIMESGLLSRSTPDIIVWDHGVNDNLMSINSWQRLYLLQRFYQAIVALPQSCDYSDPPLVIFLDSFLGGWWGKVADTLRSSVAMSSMVTWYPDIWGISYANIVRPYVLSNDQSKMLQLLGSNGVKLHPGMMYHISIAWTILFNLLYVLHDNCIVQNFLEPPKSLSSDQLTTYHKLSSIPELNEVLDAQKVPKLWAERVPELMDHKECSVKKSEMVELEKQFTNHSSSSCFYVWMVNPMLGISDRNDIHNAIQPYIVQNEGWSAYQLNKRDKLGWQAFDGKGSYFELQFYNVPLTVTFMTIIYMESFGNDWKNSKLKIEVAFIKPYDMQYNTSGTQNNTALTDVDVEPSTMQYILSAYHKENTSIQVPTKLMLPNRKLGNEKSTLKLKFHLMDGKRFKIMGMAIC